MKLNQYLFIQCFLGQLVFGGIVKMHLVPRADSQCIPIPATLNVTLPDPDPSVNATIRTLSLANFTVYRPETPVDLEGLSTDDGTLASVAYRIKRRTVMEKVRNLPRRGGGTSGGGGGTSGGGGSRGGSSSSSSGSSISTSGSSKPVTGSVTSGGSSSKPPISGASTFGNNGNTFNGKPASPAVPAQGIPVKVPTVVMGYPVYNTMIKPTTNGVRPYYNSLPASRSPYGGLLSLNSVWVGSYEKSRSRYESRYYGSYYGYGGYGPSTFGWYSYSYLGIMWWYPSWIYIDDNPSRYNSITKSTSANESIPQDVFSNVTVSTPVGARFNDPMSRNTSMSQGVISLDASGTLYAVDEKDYDNNDAVHWVPDHLLDADLLATFFNASNRMALPVLSGNNSWDSIFYSMRSCGPYPRGVAAILNSPTNLVGLDIVLNHLKSLVLLRPNGPIDWKRPKYFYQGLYNYLTLIRPNFLATAQALDTLIAQMAGTPTAKDIFATWAAQRFDNATQLVISALPPK
ncbi:MAG: hypothetical protein M1814_004770 [Vezdaea aestivalis]|nr:MAG: hypothetical protein M1814_004770 [Vezdaea aestivalis]